VCNKATEKFMAVLKSIGILLRSGGNFESLSQDPEVPHRPSVFPDLIWRSISRTESDFFETTP